MKKTSHFVRRLMATGVALGLLFPIVAIWLDLYVHDLSWSLANIEHTFRQNPIQFIVATALVVLPGIFYVLGQVISRREEQLSVALEQERIHTNAIGDILTNFYNTDRSVHIASDRLLNTLEEFKLKYRQDRERETQQKWHADGMSQLGQLLYASDNQDDLSGSLVRFLAKYCGFSQAAMFVLVDRNDERWLELKATYATEVNTELTKETIVPLGNGLVGECFEARKAVIVNNVPKNYLKISSGLGHSDATFLAILPLKNEVHIEGVLEVAGFKAPEKHVMEFLEKAAHNMASAFYHARINSVTRDLLEESQQQAEEMRAQEEEMRQTMEELTATQEEVLRKEREYIKRIEELELRDSDHERREWEYKHQLEQLRTQLEAK